jgi:hypothetical protein
MFQIEQFFVLVNLRIEHLGYLEPVQMMQNYFQRLLFHHNILKHTKPQEVLRL